MSKLLYKVINPVVKVLLQSSLHKVMSNNTVLLKFKGRKTGKALSTPVSYRATNNNEIHCFTERENLWWKNLISADTIELVLQGKKQHGKPTVIADNPSLIAEALTQMLITVPRDAPYTGVKLDSNGQPDQSDIQQAAKRTVLISIKLLN